MTGKIQNLDDEISIADILVKLWRRRVLIVLMPMLAGILGLFAVLLMAVPHKLCTTST